MPFETFWSLISCRVSSFPILALCSLRKCPAKQILTFMLNFQCYRNETKVFVFPFNRVTFFVLGLKLGTTFIWIILNKGQGLTPFAAHTRHKITIVSPLTAYLRTSNCKQWVFFTFFLRHVTCLQTACWIKFYVWNHYRSFVMPLTGKSRVRHGISTTFGLPWCAILMCVFISLALLVIRWVEMSIRNRCPRSAMNYQSVNWNVNSTPTSSPSARFKLVSFITGLCFSR